MKKSLLALAAVGALITTPALAADSKKNIPDAALTCKVYDGSSFVLNDNDFKALNSSEADMPSDIRKNGGYSREYFASLKTTSVLRQQMCDSRGLFRRIAAGICRKDDFQKNFRLWLPQFFNDNERDILINCQINIATE